METSETPSPEDFVVDQDQQSATAFPPEVDHSFTPQLTELDSPLANLTPSPYDDPGEVLPQPASELGFGLSTSDQSVVGVQAPITPFTDPTSLVQGPASDQTIGPVPLPRLPDVEHTEEDKTTEIMSQGPIQSEPPPAP